LKTEKIIEAINKKYQRSQKTKVISEPLSFWPQDRGSGIDKDRSEQTLYPNLYF
jgi:hypothetical protein